MSPRQQIGNHTFDLVSRALASAEDMDRIATRVHAHNEHLVNILSEVADLHTGRHLCPTGDGDESQFFDSEECPTCQVIARGAETMPA